LKSGLIKDIRFDVLDFYRYGGALFVALDHFVYVYTSVDLSVKTRIHTELQPLMGFFFTLSGFVMMHVYDGRISTTGHYIEYLQKRLARIYPLHFATFGLAIFWWWMLSWRPSYWFSSDAILPNIFLVHAWNTTSHLSFNYPSWSVSAEYFVYLLFPAFLLAADLLGLWGALLLPLVSAVAISLFFNTWGHRPWTYATYDFGCLRAVPSFLAGMAIYRIATVRFATLVVPAWAAHGLAIATIPMMLLGLPSVLVLAILVVVVFLLARAEPPSPGILSTRLFRALACCSYSFYMLHAFVGEAILSQASKWIVRRDGLGMFGLVAFALVITTAISILSFRFFEDPARRYFGSMTLRRRGVL
jgi:peptidoglycan/LPS O-acetylase OafA/YrhL